MSNKTGQSPDVEVFELFGPTIQFLTPLPDDDDGYCLLMGDVPPGVVVPIHSHSDHETFYILAGEVQALKEDHWQTFGAGDVFDVPGGTKHAFRNVSAKNASFPRAADCEFAAGSSIKRSVTAVCTDLAGGRPLARQRRGQRGGRDNLALVPLIVPSAARTVAKASRP
jgi:quercetin dioxygenase-like cupin family protein